MMNSKEILIAGNGYDIANGLHTKYSDFMSSVLFCYVCDHIYRAYCPELATNTQAYSKWKTILDKFKKLISEGSYSFLKTHEEKFRESFFGNQFIQILLHKYCPAVTLFKSFTKAVVKQGAGSKTEQVLSTNIDKECYRLLSIIFDREKENRNLQKQGAFVFDLRWLDVENIILEIVSGDVCNELKKILPPGELEIFYTLLNDSSFNDSIEHIIFYKPVLKEIDLVECKTGLDMFCAAFQEYLTLECKNYNSTENHEEFKLKDKYDYLISLNYTPICRNSLKIDSDKYCCFIHGMMSDSNVVMGTGSFSYNNEINDETMNKTPFYKFFQRILYKTDEKYREWVQCAGSHFNLTCYGFSFGKNDYDLIKELIVDSYEDKGFVKESIKHTLDTLTIYCYDSTALYENVRNLTTFLGKKLSIELKPKLNFQLVKTKK